MADVAQLCGTRKTRPPKPIFYRPEDKDILSGGDMSFTTILLGIAAIGGYLFLFIAPRRWFPTTGEGMVSDKPVYAPIFANDGDGSNSKLYLTMLAIGSIVYFAFMKEGQGHGFVSLIHARYLAETNSNIVIIDAHPLQTVALIGWYLIALPICIVFNLYYKNAIVLLAFVFGALISCEIIDIKLSRPLEENLMARYHYAHCTSRDFVVGIGRGRQYYATYEPQEVRCASILPKP